MAADTKSFIELTYRGDPLHKGFNGFLHCESGKIYYIPYSPASRRQWRQYAKAANVQLMEVRNRGRK